MRALALLALCSVAAAQDDVFAFFEKHGVPKRVDGQFVKYDTGITRFLNKKMVRVYSWGWNLGDGRVATIGMRTGEVTKFTKAERKLPMAPRGVEEMDYKTFCQAYALTEGVIARHMPKRAGGTAFQPRCSLTGRITAA